MILDFGFRILDFHPIRNRKFKIENLFSCTCLCSLSIKKFHFLLLLWLNLMACWLWAAIFHHNDYYSLIKMASSPGMKVNTFSGGAPIRVLFYFLMISKCIRM